MSTTPTTRARWELTAEAFAKLLAGFDSTPERAAAQYESLRLALVKFFDWQGALFPEELADETFNRVARKLDEGAELRDATTYCHGVARLVLMESRKRAEYRRAEFDEAINVADPREADETADDDERRNCFDRCLNELPAENRRLVLSYYQHDKRQKIDGRQALADQLGLPLNALRSRVQRIRDRLEQCVRQCLARKNFRG
ncbi:MAG: sigma-70 family RNA polymerase sigma factor [Acidobacteriota bacterium]|nr:sigma-70 family RNA polymerase sigma factor [Acidobacteriota bacterium]